MGRKGREEKRKHTHTQVFTMKGKNLVKRKQTSSFRKCRVKNQGIKGGGVRR